MAGCRSRREDDPADRNQNEADRTLWKTNRYGEEIDPAPTAGALSGLPETRAGGCTRHSWRLHPRSTRPPPGLHARRSPVAGKFADRAASPQNHDPIAYSFQQFRHLARSDENAEPLRGEFAYAGVNLALRADVDPARRLVQQQEPRSAEHFLGEHDLLLVAAGQGADRKPPATPDARRMSEWPCGRVHLLETWT